MEDDDSLGALWKEGGNLLKRGALCHDVISSHDELMETIKKWNGKTSWASGTMEDSPILSLDAKVRKLGTVIFWKSDCVFNNYPLSSS